MTTPRAGERRFALHSPGCDFVLRRMTHVTRLLPEYLYPTAEMAREDRLFAAGYVIVAVRLTGQTDGACWTYVADWSLPAIEGAAP